MSRSASTEITPSSQCGALVSSRPCATWRNSSPVHVLTHVFCMVWESLLSPSARCACRGCVSRARLLWFGVLLGMVVGSALQSMRPLSCVAGNVSSLEPLPRRSAICTFRRPGVVRGGRWFLSSVLPAQPSRVATPHESAVAERLCVGDRGLRSFCFGLRGQHPSVIIARSRSCLRCAWLRASWSVGTSRRRHARID